MKRFVEDPEYIAADVRRRALDIEGAELTHKLDTIQVNFLRDGTRVSAYDRAVLTERRSAGRLEIKLLTAAMRTIKYRVYAENKLEQEQLDAMTVE